MGGEVMEAVFPDFDILDPAVV
ncbi:MAG: hypothetical protein RL383_1512, partial [Actinomycetota bacterium]